MYNMLLTPCENLKSQASVEYLVPKTSVGKLRYFLTTKKLKPS